jgi:hypothetical protein
MKASKLTPKKYYCPLCKTWHEPHLWRVHARKHVREGTMKRVEKIKTGNRAVYDNIYEYEVLGG